MKIKGLIKELKLQRSSLYKEHRKLKIFSAEYFRNSGKLKMVNEIIKLIEV